MSVAAPPTPPQEAHNGSASSEPITTVGSSNPQTTPALSLVAGLAQAPLVPSSTHTPVLDGPTLQLNLTPADLSMHEKSVGLGAALSVMPGAGLLYADHPVAGALLMGTFITGVVGIIYIPVRTVTPDQTEYSVTSTYAPDGTLLTQSVTQTAIDAPYLGASLHTGAFIASTAAVVTSAVLSLVTTVPAIQRHNARVKAIQSITGGQNNRLSFKLTGAGLRGTF